MDTIEKENVKTSQTTIETKKAGEEVMECPEEIVNDVVKDMDLTEVTTNLGVFIDSDYDLSDDSQDVPETSSERKPIRRQTQIGRDHSECSNELQAAPLNESNKRQDAQNTTKMEKHQESEPRLGSQSTDVNVVEPFFPKQRTFNNSPNVSASASPGGTVAMKIAFNEVDEVSRKEGQGLGHISGYSEVDGNETEESEAFIDSEDDVYFDTDSENQAFSEVEDAGLRRFVKVGERLFSKQVKELDWGTNDFQVPNSRCALKCTEYCDLFIKSLENQEVECFKEGLKGKAVMETKQKILGHLQKQSDLGYTAMNYMFKSHSFCIKFLSSLIGVSEYILKTVQDDYYLGVKRYIHGNDSKPKESLAVAKFTAWLTTFSQLYGQNAPDEDTTVLPAWLTKATIFRIYLQECTPPIVKRSTFYHLFKMKFGPYRDDLSLPHIRISKYSTHSVCPQCVALASYKRSCKTEQEIEYCKALQFQHKQLYGLARRRICELQQLALSYPEDHLFISLDGMDNRKSDLPRFKENSKNLANFFKLPSHITGAIISSGHYAEKMKHFFFVNHNQFEQGSNMVITVIYHLLHDFLKDHKKFPKHLHLNTDNCGRENKNRYVFTFLSALVQLGVFSSISMDFLLVGHTGNEVDRNFSILAKLFKERDIKCIDDLIDIMKNAPFNPKASCFNLFYVFDWKKYIQDKVARTPLENHSFYHSFKIVCENGQAKFRGKLYPQDDEYIPETGIQLLKEGIEFDAVGPTDFRIEKLELDKVFRCLHYFLSTLPTTERIRVSSSWEALRKTLDSLPTRKDNLMKMKISEFPEQSADTAPGMPEHIGQFLPDLEDVPHLRGELFHEVSEGDFNREAAVGADVVVYTREKENRPWVGRVVKVLPKNKFTLQWYKRRSSRANTFHAMVSKDGSPVLSTQDTAVVMYWHISEPHTRTENSFRLSTCWLEKIYQDYSNHDEAYE